MFDLFHTTRAALRAERARCRAVEAQRRADAPLKATKPQQACDIDLFSDDVKQGDLFALVSEERESSRD
jgi:hypothetical protein